MNASLSNITFWCFRSCLLDLEGWRANHDGRCARTDASVSSLAEDTNALNRRCQRHQEALAERTTQADLALALKEISKAVDMVAAAAIAPMKVSEA